MKKVLVIEDDVPLCWLLQKILQSKYDVSIMKDGMEAWSWLSDGNLPNLIITDLNMPSLDGIELLDNISNSGLFRNIPVIILSGHDDFDKRKQCLAMGAFTYLVKPFEPQYLLTEVDRALEFQGQNVFVK